MSNFRKFSQKGGNVGNIDSQSFSQSNSMIAKAAFVTLILIVFIICLTIGSQILQWLFSPSRSPKLLNGMKRAGPNEELIISSNPQKKGAVPILRSNDERYGVEFAWSVWIYINNLDYMEGYRKHIFHKGSAPLGASQADGSPSQQEEGVEDPWSAAINESPGLYLHKNNNSLIVVMDTFKGYSENIEIDDIPTQKWLNVIIRVEGNIVDVYINGSIAHRHILNDVVKQNYGDTYINVNGGFDGFMSNLQYFSWAPSISEILRIINDGPNLNMIEDNTSGLEVFPPYLSTRWYFN